MKRRRALLAVLLLLLIGGGSAWYARDTPDETEQEPQPRLQPVPTRHGPRPLNAVEVDFREPRDGRQRVQRPPEVVRLEETTHVRLTADGVRGRILDENGDPLAGVSVLVQRVQRLRGAELDEWLGDPPQLRTSGTLGHDDLGRVATVQPTRHIEADAEGWFESGIPEYQGWADMGRVTVYALIPGRRPFLVSWLAGESPPDVGFSVPTLHDGSTVALRWAHQSVEGVALRFGDVTDGSQLHNARRLIVIDGRVSTERFVDDRTYVVSGEWIKGRIYGAFKWRGQSEIDLSDLLRKW